MTTTQLFVELLVIGLGASVWISLMVDIFTGGQTRFSEVWSDKAFILPLVAAAYAVGIVLDRLAWSMFAALERPFETEYVLPLALPSWRVERSVVSGSEISAKDLYYNRSRLRICRAWVNGSDVLLGVCCKERPAVCNRRFIPVTHSRGWPPTR